MYLYYFQGAPDWVVEATCLTLAYLYMKLDILSANLVKTTLKKLKLFINDILSKLYS